MTTTNSVRKLMRMWAIFCWTDGKFCNKIKVSIIIKLFPLKSVFGLESVIKSKQTPNVSPWPVAPNGSNQNWKKINTTGAEREVERATKAHALPQSSFWKLSRSDCQIRQGRRPSPMGQPLEFLSYSCVLSALAFGWKGACLYLDDDDDDADKKLVSQRTT